MLHFVGYILEYKATDVYRCHQITEKVSSRHILGSKDSHNYIRLYLAVQFLPIQRNQKVA